MAEQLALCPDCLEFVCECNNIDLKDLITIDDEDVLQAWQDRLGSIVRRSCYNDMDEPDGLHGMGYWESGDYG